MKKFVKILVILIVTFILLVILGKGIDTGSKKVAKSSDDTLKIATYNIDSKDNPNAKKMIKQLKTNGVEIVGVQEVDMNNDRNNFDMMKAFKGTDFPNIHFAKGRDFANGQFGNGLISALNFEEISTVPIDSSGGFATKTLERAVIKKGDKKVAIYNTHLSFESTELRKRQFFQILERVKKDPIQYKVILGDFNADSNMSEYAMFLNDFNLVNGQDGKWWNSFRLPDKEMKVYTVDNIIVSKNIKIKQSKMVESDLSDHNMLVASLELLAKDKSKKVTNNIALGQKVTATSTYEKANQAMALTDMAVDNDEETQWESAVNLPINEEQSLVMELNKPYNLTDMELLWGENRATKYRVEVSKDGVNYETVKSVENEAENLTDKVKLAQNDIHFVRLVLTDIAQTDVLKFHGYMLKEWRMYGQEAKPVEKTVNPTNLLKFVGNDSSTNQVAINNSKNITISSEKNVFKIKNVGKEDEHAEIILRDIPVTGGQDYDLFFANQGLAKNTGALTFEVFPKDKDGHVQMSNYGQVTDILKKNKHFNPYHYLLHTASEVTSLDIVFKINGGENVGDISLKDLSLKRIKPISFLEMVPDKKFVVGDTTKFSLKSDGDFDAEKVIWQSSDNTIAEIKGNQVTFKKAGHVKIKAHFKEEARYTSEKEITVFDK